jgi:hypothetical protein
MASSIREGNDSLNHRATPTARMPTARGGYWDTVSQHDIPTPDSQTDDELHRIAEETSRTIQPPDPYTEPPNSTVDDWFGQRVAADEERVDDMLEQQQADPDAPGAYIDDTEGEIPEPNEPA